MSPRLPGLLRSGGADVRRQPASPPGVNESFRRIGFALDPPAGDIGLLREVERFPFVPGRSATIATGLLRAYNIQVSGLGNGCGRWTIEGRYRCVRGLDSTHARSSRPMPWTREGRPRSGIPNFALPGLPPGSCTKINPSSWRALGVVTLLRKSISATPLG